VGCGGMQPHRGGSRPSARSWRSAHAQRRAYPASRLTGMKSMRRGLQAHRPRNLLSPMHHLRRSLGVTSAKLGNLVWITASWRATTTWLVTGTSPVTRIHFAHKGECWRFLICVSRYERTPSGSNSCVSSRQFLAPISRTLRKFRQCTLRIPRDPVACNASCGYRRPRHRHGGTCA